MAIHFPEHFKSSLVDSFKQRSHTESSMSHDLDEQFSGVNTVHVMSIITEDLEDYNRTIDPTKGSRYGTVKEVQDTVQTFRMREDKSFTLSIDKGNNKEQLNMKKMAQVMAAQRDERIVPWLDKLRLRNWARDAGTHLDLGVTLTAANVVSKIIAAHNTMVDNGAPEDGATLYLARKYLTELKLSTEWTALDSLGGKSLPSGSIGEFDGMAVKPIPSSRMPEGVAFMIVHKSAVIAPIKIHEMKGHVDPVGLSGDLIEFRMITDAFVLGRKAVGVLVGCETGTVTAEPTFSGSSNAVTISSADGGTIYYTLDGSDPRYSSDAVTYTGPVDASAGRLRAYASASGKFNSSVADYSEG